MLFMNFAETKPVLSTVGKRAGSPDPGLRVEGAPDLVSWHPSVTPGPLWYYKSLTFGFPAPAGPGKFLPGWEDVLFIYCCVTLPTPKSSDLKQSLSFTQESARRAEGGASSSCSVLDVTKVVPLGLPDPGRRLWWLSSSLGQLGLPQARCLGSKRDQNKRQEVPGDSSSKAWVLKLSRPKE